MREDVLYTIVEVFIVIVIVVVVVVVERPTDRRTMVYVVASKWKWDVDKSEFCHHFPTDRRRDAWIRHSNSLSIGFHGDDDAH